MVDVMVLGNSLQEHGVKAEKVLCINDDTKLNGIADLMGAFLAIRAGPAHASSEAPQRVRAKSPSRSVQQIADSEPFFLPDARDS